MKKKICILYTGGTIGMVPTEKGFENGTIITVCSQCANGTVKLGAYETSSALTRAGAVSGYNMTTESAVAKLYYLFSLRLPRDEIKRLMEEDLRGELTR